jgi:outer membrane protein TolC
MSWRDLIRKTVSDIAEGASREVEIVRLQAQIAGLESERDRQLLEAGKRARELHRAGKIADTDLDILMRRVEEAEAEIEQLQAKVADLRRGAPDRGASSAPDQKLTE